MQNIRFQILLCAMALSFFAIAQGYAQTTNPVVTANQISLNDQLSTLNSPVLKELFRLRIVNDRNGEIACSKDCGTTWQPLGKVTKPCNKIEPKGFTASKWVMPGRVAATAVNAIHITTDYDPVEDRASVFSLVPSNIVETTASFFSPSASIITSIPAGTGIFGGGFAPFVGNRVWVERNGQGDWMQKGYVPAQGDVLIIRAETYSIQPTQVVFQNHAGGLIWLQWPDGSRKAIGWVIRPVLGVGRFLGTQYAAAGRIRANHPGVIDIACSALGKMAGFQIIPEHHAHDPEMGKALTMTQWMIVAPLSPQDHWEGVVPLFYQYIRPNYLPSDLYAPDWQERLLSHFLAEVKTGDGLWYPCPSFSLDPDLNKPLPEWANRALAEVTEVRILFPLN